MNVDDIYGAEYELAKRPFFEFSWKLNIFSHFGYSKNINK